MFSKANPANDADWISESFAHEASQQLKMIGDYFVGEQLADAPATAIDALVDPGFRGTALRPELAEVFRDRAMAVFRFDAGEDEGAAGQFAGHDGFSRAASAWRGHYRPGGEIDVHWKIVRVEGGEQAEGDGSNAGTSTTVLFESSGIGVDGLRLAQTATLECGWVPVAAESGAGGAPRLVSLTVTQFEEVHDLSGGGRSLFTDASDALFRDVPSYREQLAFGADHWDGEFDVAFGIHQGNQGISVGDVNGDGREDVFVCQPAGLPSRLYLQTGDGRLRDATVEAGLDWLDDARSALFIDLDGDGDEDLALALGYSLTLHENDGAGRFRLRVEVDMYSWPSSMAAADYDGDGDLDIYVCGYTPRGDVEPGDIFANPVPYHDANNGARNFFLENRGPFEFADVTQESGFAENNRRFSFAASWEDYDDAGDQDLYVANDFGRNNLYRNDRAPDGTRKFIDVAAAAGVEDIAAGMSVSWGDYNRDGLVDLYVGNMFSSAGNRIAFQRQFKAAADGTARQNLQRHARGNTLFENRGDGTFKDVSVEAGVTMGRWAWASHCVDLNNDGWEDLFVTNGFFTREDSGDL